MADFSSRRVLSISDRQSRRAYIRGGVIVALIAVFLPTLLAQAATDVVVGVAGNEPHAAVVNPLNPQNLVVSRGVQLLISNDFGTTFPITVNPAAAPPTPGANQAWGNCGDDVIAFDHLGRLFWSYLRCLSDTSVSPPNRIDISIFVQQVNGTTGALVGAEVEVTPGLHSDDKQWIAADANPASPFAGNLYLHWTRFDNSPTEEFFSRSTDGGLTWSAPIAVATGAGEGFRHQAHTAVAPNGDVYLSYHTDTCGAATDGRIRVIRDSTGGASLATGTVSQVNDAFTAGNAAVTCNRQPQAGAIPGAAFLMQGSAVGYVIPDPVRPGTIYVFTNDDPNNAYASGDDGDIVMARSVDNGQNWSAPVHIDHGPSGTLQALPAAAIDQNGNLVVTWYDTRGGQRNANNNFLLDTYGTFSRDGGLTWTNDIRINDQPFNADVGAPNFGNPPDNPPTWRIGEYNGLVATDGIAYLAFTGNAFSGSTATGQQIISDVFSIHGAFPDRFEPNDAIAPGVVTDLGATATYDEQDLTIHGSTDEDFFRVVALSSGVLDARIGSNPRLSDLDLQVRDRNNNVIATSTPNLDVNADERIQWPAVAGQTYFVRVYAEPGASAAATQFPSLNVYSFSAVNRAATAPVGLALALGSDTGLSTTDNVTKVALPSFAVRVDLTSLAGIGFSPGTTPGTDPPGYKVLITVDGGAPGYAAPIGPGSPGNFSFTPSLPLSDGLHLVTARVQIVDPRQPPHAVGDGPESSTLSIVVDTTPPASPSVPDLTDSSDTGGVSDDNVTTLQSPTFVGAAVPNSSVILFANGLQVGTGASDGNGAWQITASALADGVYQITAAQEDVAGNLSLASAGLKVTIANQSLTLAGATALAPNSVVGIDLVAGTVSGYGGVPGLTGRVGIVGIPVVNLNANGQKVDVKGTAGDDNLTYTPTSATAGSLSRAGVSQTINLSNVSRSAAGLIIDTLAGSDVVTTIGTTNADNVTTELGLTAVTKVNTLLALSTVTGALERLAVSSGDGADTVAVTTNSAVTTLVFVDAGNPATNTPNGDLLRITDGSGKGQLLNGPGGAVAGSGSFIMSYKAPANQTRIDYSGIEKLSKK